MHNDARIFNLEYNYKDLQQKLEQVFNLLSLMKDKIDKIDDLTGDMQSLKIKLAELTTERNLKDTEIRNSYVLLSKKLDEIESVLEELDQRITFLEKQQFAEEKMKEYFSGLFEQTTKKLSMILVFVSVLLSMLNFIFAHLIR